MREIEVTVSIPDFRIIITLQLSIHQDICLINCVRNMPFHSYGFLVSKKKSVILVKIKK